MTALLRRLAVVLAVLAVVVSGVATTAGTVGSPAASGSVDGLRTVADTSRFQPGNIISDAVFFDGDAMTRAQVQAFLDTKGASCRTGADGTPCLRVYTQTTTDRAADAYCDGYVGAAGETAATIITRVAASCDVSPRVLLVLMQKEQSLVTNTGSSLTATRYQKTMGFACPDTAACDSTYSGFQNQVYSAARQFQRYAANAASYNYRAGRTNTVLYNPSASCGSSPVFIQNQATAGLYVYTPYQPNQAALEAGYGSGDGCSAYGNRNFWLYFTDWFGSTQSPSAPGSVPTGSLDTVTSAEGRLTLRGWALDLDQPTTALTVHVYANGAPVVAAVADLSRPDVGTAHPTAGSRHGYEITAALPLGEQQVCVYALDAGAGTTNPLLGCQTVQNTDLFAPVGSLDTVATTPGTVRVGGWVYDPDAPAAAASVRVYVDGVAQTVVVASSDRPDVTAAMGESVGGAHGFDRVLDVRPGQHTVCVYGLNTGRGTTNTTLGCRSVAVEDPADYDPVGRVDQLTASGGTVVLRGWVYDPDAPAAPADVHVYVDGSLRTVVTAAGPRPDVARALPAAGPSHGLSWSAVLPAGRHQVCAYAVNTGFGTTNPTLGCATVTTVAGAQAQPRGVLDGVSLTGQTALVRGWAYDPDEPTGPATVHVYVDGRLASVTAASADRPDVAAAVPGAGPAHGLELPLVLSPGTHQVCAYGINTGAGEANPLLGCRTLTVAATGAPPLGSLDSVTPGAAGVTATGWAFDPDAPTRALAVHVYLDGQAAGAVTAAARRPDVAAVHPSAGADHGWEWTGQVTAGRHEVCVYAVDVDGRGPNTTLGCRTFTR